MLQYTECSQGKKLRSISLASSLISFYGTTKLLFVHSNIPITTWSDTKDIPCWEKKRRGTSSEGLDKDTAWSQMHFWTLVNPPGRLRQLI